MIKRTLLPLRLMENYGKTKMTVFYPDSWPSNRIVTSRDVIDLYRYCLKMDDAEALQLLSETYDINALMEFDKTYNSAIPMNSDFTQHEKKLHVRRVYGRDVLKVKTLYGGKHFQKLFKVLDDGSVVFSARQCIFEMSTDQVDALCAMSVADIPPNFSGASIIEKYEVLCNLPDRDRPVLDRKSGKHLYYRHAF